MISNILNALVKFQEGATPDGFKRIFGTAGAGHLWTQYHGICKCNPVAFYAYIGPSQRLLFEAHLSANLPALYIEPRCVECGGELSESDIQAGEDVCLDCAAQVALERDERRFG